jgi:hypothetical protein
MHGTLPSEQNEQCHGTHRVMLGALSEIQNPYVLQWDPLGSLSSAGCGVLVLCGVSSMPTTSHTSDKLHFHPINHNSGSVFLSMEEVSPLWDQPHQKGSMNFTPCLCKCYNVHPAMW